MSWNEAPAPAPLWPGDPHAVAGYTVAGRLGEGGQGTVFLAYDAGGERVALKMLHARFGADPKARTRFVREVEAARRVGGFCTARVLAADLDGDVPYVVSEFIEGPSLREFVLRNGPQDGAALERLAIGTLTALVAVHRAGIVHRDFKPGNVLLSLEGPRVVDFGIARILDATSTLTSQAVGTPAFMAPEQLDGRPVTPATDLFAWGATMAYAGTGRSPFGADSVAAVVAAIFEAEPDLGGLAGPMRRVIESCLAKDPAARPYAPELLARLLGDLPADGDRTRLTATRLLTEPAAAPATMADRTRGLPAGRQSRRGLLIGAGAVTLAAALGGTLLLSRGDDRTRWRYDIHGDAVRHVAATGDTLFLALRSGALYALDAATGRPRWTSKAGPAALALSGPDLFTAGAGRVGKLDAATGRARWPVRTSTSGADPDGSGVALMLGGDVVVVAVPDPSGDASQLDRVTVTAFGAANGERRWRRTIAHPHEQLTAGPLGPVAASPRVAVVMVGATLYGLATATGTVRWQFHLGGNQPGAIVVSGDTVLVGGGNVGQAFHALDAATGRHRWQAPILEFNRDSLAADAQTVYVADANDVGGVHALDLRTGRERWRRTDVGATETWGPAGGLVYASTEGDQRAWALDAATGRTFWERAAHVAATGTANATTAFLITSGHGDDQTVYAVRGREPGTR